MITLHIKGTAKQAKRAASRRQVTVVKCEPARSGKVKCTVKCSDANYKRIAEWYGEKTGAGKPGRGFSPGTIVFSRFDCGASPSKGSLSGVCSPKRKKGRR